LRQRNTDLINGLPTDIGRNKIKGMTMSFGHHLEHPDRFGNHLPTHAVTSQPSNFCLHARLLPSSHPVALRSSSLTAPEPLLADFLILRLPSRIHQTEELNVFSSRI